MLNPQAAISTPGPAPFYDRSGMTEAKAKKLFAEKQVHELMRLFKLSRSSVFAWRQKWGITKPLTEFESARSLQIDHLWQRRAKIEKELVPEIEQMRTDHEDMVTQVTQLRAENAVLQRLVRDLTIEVGVLTAKGKKS